MALPKIQITENDSDDEPMDASAYKPGGRRCSMPVVLPSSSRTPRHHPTPTFLSPESCRPAYQRQRSKSHGTIEPLPVTGACAGRRSSGDRPFYEALYNLEYETLTEAELPAGAEMPHGSSVFEQIMKDMNDVSLEDEAKEKKEKKKGAKKGVTNDNTQKHAAHK